MFQDFDRSGDGSVSVKEYVAGVKAWNDSGSNLFMQMMSRYMRGADRQADDQGAKKILNDGPARVAQYWECRQ